LVLNMGSTLLKVWTHQDLVKATQAAEDPQEALNQAIQAKEEEKARLVRRLGLLTDEDAVAAVAARLGEVVGELRELRAKVSGKSEGSKLDALRARLGELLEMTARMRQAMSETLPRRKAEYLRKLIKEIRVKHEERKMGKLRSSKLIQVEIVPVDGDSQTTNVRTDTSPGPITRPSRRSWACRTARSAGFCTAG
jgi:hypothetical protein